MRIIVIGGGAAGFFTAINIAEKHPSYEVIILEKTSKVLQKVKVSGGGRCNVTNERSAPSDLVSFYPRGSKKLRTLFNEFSSSEMIAWLHKRGVQTKAEDDKRMFPTTDSSQTIIDCFQNEIKKHKVSIRLNHTLESLEEDGDKWSVKTNKETLLADKVVVATGASPATWKILQKTGLTVSEIVPSLFTFNIKDERISKLQGISFDNAHVKIAGTKLQDEGPLLITHWGLSGPAILKLSAWGAYELNQCDYHFQIMVNFTGNQKAEEIKNHLTKYRDKNPKRKVVNYPLFDLSKRFWERITSYCGIAETIPYSELSKKQMNKLVEELGQGSYQVSGKSTFKDEFVTAGGIQLNEVDLNTFECKRFPNLYIAGETLNIDALTGGFNFQACWSAGWVISENI